MRPSPIDERMTDAEAVASSLREAAMLCDPQQHALKARLLQAAQTIDALISMTQASHFVAKLNHQTIVEMSR
jgi:hypothetical protein